ncbi:MAG: alginate O-acetyltransferase complex protein AlgI [Actinomycetota bacterium]|nr:alginate O-acetyltransferase complex protein AlgI [Actinomycetota bacterium]
MLFPTTDFAVFFSLIFAGHWILNHKPTPWKLFMIGASYVFYAWWDWRFVVLLAGVSAAAQAGATIVGRQTDASRRRAATIAAVVLVLSPLAYFKYYGFFSVSLSNAFQGLGLHLGIPLSDVVLPVGLSFFSFMAVSYVVDVSRGDAPVAATIDAFLYLSFFPHLVAGPIVRPNELIPQLNARRDQRHVDVTGAAWLILGGLFKKIVISSYVANTIVTPVFGDPTRHSAAEAFFAVVGYAVVIYSDFSGYSDIAIGVAKLLGFEFPRNFDRPYSARTLQEFWRRWHMTLSRWLRDYVYIPLGGNRRGPRRTTINIMLTMVLGGLWHGAGWTFILWGALHGGGLLAGRWHRARRPDTRAPTGAVIWGQRLATFAFVCLGWVFFRADSLGTAFGLLGRFLAGWGTPTTLVGPLLVGTIGLSLGLQLAPRGSGAWIRERVGTLRPLPMGLLFAGVLFITTSLGPQGVAPFIYFRF